MLYNTDSWVAIPIINGLIHKVTNEVQLINYIKSSNNNID